MECEFPITRGKQAEAERLLPGHPLLEGSRRDTEGSGQRGHGKLLTDRGADTHTLYPLMPPGTLPGEQRKGMLSERTGLPKATEPGASRTSITHTCPRAWSSLGGSFNLMKEL